MDIVIWLIGLTVAAVVLGSAFWDAESHHAPEDEGLSDEDIEAELPDGHNCAFDPCDCPSHLLPD